MMDRPTALNAILDVLDALVVVMDHDGRITRFNHACERATGYAEDEVAGHVLWETLIAERDRGQVQRVFHSLIGGGFPNHNENTWISKSGHERLIAWSNTTMEDDKGKITHVIGTGIDITDDVKARRSLKHTYARLQSVVDTSRDTIISIDEMGIIIDVNEMALETFGYEPSEMLGQNVNILMPTDSAEKHDGYISRYKETGVRHIIGSTRQVMAKRKDGSVFPADIAIGEVNLNGYRVFTGFIRDMTLTRNAEARNRVLQDELTHAMRLSDMGEMVANITHEINQPLSAISNYIHACEKLLKNDTTDSHENVKELLSLVGEQTQRADGIINNIRNFLTHGETQRQVGDLNEIILNALQLALFGVSDEADLHILLAQDLPKVCVDRVQIQQVAVNLVRNALDAIHDTDKQHITIETRISDGNMVEINIIDTGPGIAAEVQERLFQPFVTTKKDGMGLGLSICKNIVEVHDGFLAASTNDRGDTVFSIRLPLHEGGMT